MKIEKHLSRLNEYKKSLKFAVMVELNFHMLILKTRYLAKDLNAKTNRFWIKFEREILKMKNKYCLNDSDRVSDASARFQRYVEGGGREKSFLYNVMRLSMFVLLGKAIKIPF